MIKTPKRRRTDSTCLFQSLFHIPKEKPGMVKKSIDFLATARQGSIALLNIFFANFSVKKDSKSERITRFFALNFIKKYCLQGAEQF